MFNLTQTKDLSCGSPRQTRCVEFMYMYCYLNSWYCGAFSSPLSHTFHNPISLRKKQKRCVEYMYYYLISWCCRAFSTTLSHTFPNPYYFPEKKAKAMCGIHVLLSELNSWYCRAFSLPPSSQTFPNPYYFPEKKTKAMCGIRVLLCEYRIL